MRAPNPPDLALSFCRLLSKAEEPLSRFPKRQIAEAKQSLGSERYFLFTWKARSTWAAMLVLCDRGWLRPTDSVVFIQHFACDEVCEVCRVQLYPSYGL